MSVRSSLSLCAALFLGAVIAPLPSGAQTTPPPAVGVTKVEMRPVTETADFVGRIQAIDKVDLVARVNAFIDKRTFTEGAEVKAGDLLFLLERGPFEADTQQKAGVLGEKRALLVQATNTMNRAKSLLNSPAGQRAAAEDSETQMQAAAAQVLQAEAQLKASQINLAYTEIKAPIAGKIGRTILTEGNVVGPTSGPLATIVSQDPMYVVFPVSARAEQDLVSHYADRGGLVAVAVKVRHQDGRMHAESGKIEYVDPSVSQSTDTILLRAKIPNPPRAMGQAGALVQRDLVDGEFVTVIVQGLEPVQALAVPRTAILTDQLGSYVYVVDADNKAQKRPVKLGQMTPEFAAITDGPKEGETVIAEGLQRVRPGAVVAPGPLSPAPSAGAATPAAKS
jgi:membrane fusion protein (multidrug efflux system)